MKPGHRLLRASIVLLTVIVACAGAATAQERPAQPDITQLFLQAHQAYREADFDKAAQLYESIIAAGIANGELYYNLGNACLKRGDLGKAVLCYRTAEMLMPRDEDLQTNLAYARSLTRDQLECREPFAVLARFCFWYAKLTGDELIIGFLAANFLFWLLLTLRGFLKSEIISTVTYGLLFVTLVLGASAGIKAYNTRLRHQGVVIGKEILVRSGSSASDTVLFKLHEGTEFAWLEDEAGWVKIMLCDDKKGWVQQDVVAKIGF
jgi:hypothetical protein